MLTQLKRSYNAPKKFHRSICGASRYACEALERRVLLSTINWVNKGNANNDSDGFNATFQGDATAARNVVSAALMNWQRIIANFNYADSGLNDTYQITINMQPGAAPNQGGNGTPTTFDSSGKPTAGTFNINRGTDGHEAGWYIDPNPNDSAEFSGSILDPFTALKSPGVNGADLFTVTSHEVGHCLGFTNDARSAFQINANHYLANTGVADPDQTPGIWWTFTGPDVNALLTTDNGGGGGTAFLVPVHMAEIGFSGVAASYTNPTTGVKYYEGRDLMVPAGQGWRQLPSYMDALILKDAYGFTVNPPQQFGTFYANYNGASGQLVVSGGQQSENNPYTPSSDVISIYATPATNTLFVSVSIGSPVPGNGPNIPYISQFPLSSISTILVNAGDGNDTINYGGGNLSSIPEATINAGSGTDMLNVDDSAYAAVTTYEVLGTQINRQSYFLGVAQFDSSVETVKFLPGTGSNDVVDVYSTTEPTTIQSGNTSLINIGSNGSLQGINGALTITNPTTHSALNIDDSADSISRDALLTSTGLTGLSPVAISWNANDINGVTVSGGTGGNIFRVTGLPPLFGGAQNAINAGSSNDSVIMEYAQATLVVNGQGGSDTLTVDDTISSGFTYSIGDGSVSRTGLLLAYNTIETMNLNAGNSADTVNIDALPQSTAVSINAGGNFDQINLAPTSKQLPSFYGGLSIDGGAGGTALTFDNSSSGNISACTITGTTFTAGAGTANYANTYSLAYNLASFVNTVTISDTTNVTSYVINGGNGNDTLNLGSGNIGGIVSNITFVPGGGTDALNINDQNDPTAQSYTFGTSSLAVASLFTVNYSVILESITLNAGNGTDTIAVNGELLFAPLTVNAGGGNDSIIVGSAPNYFSNLNAAVTVNGGAGTDSLTVNDENGYGYRISSTAVTDLFNSSVSHSINYGTLEGVTLNTFGGGVNCQVQSTASGTPVTINPGVTSGFGDSVSLGGAGLTLSGIVSPVTVNGLGGAGNSANNLTVDDSADTSGRIVHITPTQVGAISSDTLFGAGGFLNYSGVATLAVNASNATTGDRIYARPSAATAITINAGTPTTTPGDSLTLALAEASNAHLTPNGTGAGQYTFGNRMPITYTGVEQAALDTTAPSIINPSFQFNVLPQSLLFPVSENLANNPPLTSFSAINQSSLLPVLFTGGTYAGNVVTINISGTLPDGNYHATVSASGVSDVPGNPMAANFGFDFFMLTADANHDRVVNALDFNALATNYGKPATFSQGDFDYSGTVDSNDFALLASRFGMYLAPASGSDLPNAASAEVPAVSLAAQPASLFSHKPIAGDSALLDDSLANLIA